MENGPASPLVSRGDKTAYHDVSPEPDGSAVTGSVKRGGIIGIEGRLLPFSRLLFTNESIPLDVSSATFANGILGNMDVASHSARYAAHAVYSFGNDYRQGAFLTTS